MIRLMLINDYPLISSLIASSLSDQADIEVVKVYTPEEDLFTAICESGANTVLISGHYAPESVIALIKRIDAYDYLTILIMGLDNHVDQALPYIEAGAHGHILKSASVSEMAAAIRTAHNGEALVSPEAARSLIERVYTLSTVFNERELVILSKADLTSRELEVLQLIGQRISNHQIAENLFLEVGTVKNHVHAILKKLNVGSRHAAVKYLTVLKNSK